MFSLLVIDNKNISSALINSTIANETTVAVFRILHITMVAKIVFPTASGALRHVVGDEFQALRDHLVGIAIGAGCIIAHHGIAVVGNGRLPHDEARQTHDEAFLAVQISDGTGLLVGKTLKNEVASSHIYQTELALTFAGNT